MPPATDPAAEEAHTDDGAGCGQLTQHGRHPGTADHIPWHGSGQGRRRWLDLRDPDGEDLNVLRAEFGLHEVAVEDAVSLHERPKLDRYRHHLFLACYAVHLDSATGELGMSEIAAFITPRALITVRKDDGLDIGAVVQYWDASPNLAEYGVGFLLYGLLDHVVDGHFAAVRVLDDAIEGLEDRLFADNRKLDHEVQRRSFELRKSLVALRRVDRVDREPA